MTIATVLPKVLLVDDDEGVRAEMSDYLSRNGLDVRSAVDGEDMEKALLDDEYPVMVLDVMLPGEDGLSICRRLSRKRGPAILILSAMGDDVDRIVGLEIGADDYLAKPCNPRELLARVRALIRRREGEFEEAEEAPKQGYRFEGFFLDLPRRRLRLPSGVVSVLTTSEFILLNAFVENAGQVLSREKLVELSKGAAVDSVDRSIDVSVSRLRRKLGLGGDGRLIRTYRGYGYMLDAKVVAV